MHRTSGVSSMRRSLGTHALICIVSAVIAAPASQALAQVPPSYDFDFATITAANNAPYPGDPTYGQMAGRGSVPYDYRIAKMEVTTAQWVEFVNTYSILGGTWGAFALPTFWGASLDPSYSGPGYRWRVDPATPNAARFYVGGISWRTAAMYCNWLHNGKSSSTSALENGAYDTSTFGPGKIGLTFTDQWTRHKDAKYWIPSLDEWLKAAHYDPNRYGPGQEGWWEYSYMSETPPIPGPPGIGQTSGGYEVPNVWEIPLGAYAEMVSPWGLWDTSGATSEWTEEVWFPERPTFRFLKGTGAANSQPPSWHPDLEALWIVGQSRPHVGGSHYGFRVASSIPNAGTFTVAVLAVGLITQSRRRNG